MKAARLMGPGRLNVVETAVPLPGPTEVLLRVDAAAVCGSDLSIFRGLYGEANSRIRYPSTLGHEFAGTVTAVGSLVDPAIVGRRFCVEPNLRCGRCRHCTSGLPNVCPDYRVIGETPERPGAFAEYAVVGEELLHELPPTISDIEGALVQPLAIAYEGVRLRAQVERGDSVLVVGAGAIGLGSLMVARLLGARVVVTDFHDARRTVAAELGADLVVDAAREDLDQVVRGFAGESGVDVAVEAAGGAQGASLATSLRLVRRRGRVVVLGSFTRPIEVNVGDLADREVTLLGSKGHPGTFPPVIEAISSGELPAAAMVTDVIGLDALPQVFAALDANPASMIKVVVHHESMGVGRGQFV